jgi:hypothetical protein
MRVRDIVRNSFERLIETGGLPAYERRGRYTPPFARHNPVWRPEQMESTHYAAASGGLYEDDEAWQKAVEFVRAFTASRAGRGVMPWRLPAWGGSFGEVPAEDLLHHLTAGFSAFGLRTLSANTITHTAWLDSTDSAAVSALPEPFGRWLQVREGRPRWKEKVELRLAARARARVTMRPDGRFDAFADIALSGPAIFVVENLAGAMDRRLPAPATRWLPRRRRCLRNRWRG